MNTLLVCMPVSIASFLAVMIRATSKIMPKMRSTTWRLKWPTGGYFASTAVIIHTQWQLCKLATQLTGNGKPIWAWIGSSGRGFRVGLIWITLPIIENWENIMRIRQLGCGDWLTSATLVLWIVLSRRYFIRLSWGITSFRGVTRVRWRSTASYAKWIRCFRNFTQARFRRLVYTGCCILFGIRLATWPGMF